MGSPAQVRILSTAVLPRVSEEPYVVRQRLPHNAVVPEWLRGLTRIVKEGGTRFVDWGAGKTPQQKAWPSSRRCSPQHHLRSAWALQLPHASSRIAASRGEASGRGYGNQRWSGIWMAVCMDRLQRLPGGG